MEDENPPRGSSPSSPPPRRNEAGGEDGSGSVKRASVFPSIAPPPGPNYRIVFGLLWVVVQTALIATAGRRADGAFGFRMFNESSTVHIALFREVSAADGGLRRIHVDDGVWTSRGSDGARHRSSWYERVPTPFWVFDREMHASYGADAQLFRLQRALDDVALHLPASEDAETRRLALDVLVRRNGREPVMVRLTSAERAVPADADGGGP